MKKIYAAALAGCLFLVYSGCTKDTGFTSQGGNIPAYYISVKDSSFTPNVLSVSIGSTVIFTNQSSLTHTIAGDDTTQLAPNILMTGKSFSIKPLSPGTISYRCTTHPSARGVITFTP